MHRATLMPKIKSIVPP